MLGIATVARGAAVRGVAASRSAAQALRTVASASFLLILCTTLISNIRSRNGNPGFGAAFAQDYDDEAGTNFQASRPRCVYSKTVPPSSGGGGANWQGGQDAPTAWFGVNLGNLNIFPFRAARLEESEAALRQKLRDVVSEVADAGGNLIRVWFHIDGALNPCWGQSGGGSGGEEVVGCGGEAVEDLKWLLRQCHRRGVKVLLTLWSHDVLAVRRDNPPQNRDRALRLIRDPVATSAYVDRCLTPLVRHLATTPIPSPYDDDVLAASDLLASRIRVSSGGGRRRHLTQEQDAQQQADGGGGDNTQRVLLKIPGEQQAAGPQQAQRQADGGGGATYSAAVMGYDLYNEPEGTSWDLRLYHNYMYNARWGWYQFDNPDWFNSRPERAVDYRTLQAYKTFGGLTSPVVGRSDVLQYQGWHFVAGNQPPAAARATAGGGSGGDAGCLSAGSLLSPTAGSVYGSTGSSDPAQLDSLIDAVHRAEQSDELQGRCASPKVGGGAGGPVPWYGNASLSAEWEALAARVSRTQPAGGGGSGGGGGWGGTWFNQYLYWDVIEQYNSELPYLLPLVTSCRLRTADVTLPQLQRFISRLATAVHKADPRAQVTVGAHSVPYITDAQWLPGHINDFEANPRNLYSDEALRRAFRRRDGSTGPGWDLFGAGTLDFYAPHGYPDWGHSDTTGLMSPFYMSACAFQLDKPALIGEFWNLVSDSEQLSSWNWQQLYDKGGYMGGLGWAMLIVAEAPVWDQPGPGSSPEGTGGRQLSAPRRIVDHENRAKFMALLQEIKAARGGGRG